MDKTLGYLTETLSNFTDDQSLAKAIRKKIANHHYQSEEAFVRGLDEKEIEFLNKILPDEINYALEVQDYKRVHQLNEVYELLF